MTDTLTAEPTTTNEGHGQDARAPFAAVHAALARMMEEQTPHAFVPKVQVRFVEESQEFQVLHPDGAWCATDQERLAHLLSERERALALIEADNYNHGIWFDAWHENLWEICKLRVENPGVPIEFLVGGANGSAKTYFASGVMMRAMMHTKKKLFWSITMDEPNSETVQQRAVYFWLPNSYKSQSGAIKGTARGKLRWNDSGGFTDNRFSLYHGASMEFRFWSKDINTLEGPRPYAVWSDEEIPLMWLDGIRRRLLTAAEPTKYLIPQWQKLLREREKQMDDAGRSARAPFPLDKIGELMMGVHLITYTAKNGYTDTVRAFVSEGKIMRTIEADRELLPRRDENGNITGGEILPSMIYCKDPARRMRMMYAWENPLGGNWAGMQIAAKGKSRHYILWWAYGIAERASSTPFPNFNMQVHVRPKSWLPQKGTWYHIVDPVATGGRQWFHLWALVSGEQRGHIWPGDVIIAHEYPQQDDFIPGMGFVGEWALPGGKNGIGARGPAQEAWSVGYEWRAKEVRRIESKLGAWIQGDGRSKMEDGNSNLQSPISNLPISVPDGNRIMDSRPFNTETTNNSESKTIAEYMEDNGLFFLPAGRGSGAAPGKTYVMEGEQMINDALYYDRELATLNPENGFIEIDPQKGRGPKLWILDHCKNMIDALQNYPGASAESAWSDPIACLRYLIIAAPEHYDSLKQFSFNGD